MSDQYSAGYLLRRLLGLMRLSPYMTVAAVISIFTSIGFTLLLPLLIRGLINAGVASGERGAITRYAIGIALASLLSAGSAYVRSVTTQWIGERVSYELRNRMFRHLESLAFSFYDRAQTGNLLSNLTEDIRNIRRFYSPALRMIVQTTVLVIGSAGIMLYLDWRLALVAIAMVPILFTATLSFGARVRPRYLATQRQFGVPTPVRKGMLALASVESRAPSICRSYNVSPAAVNLAAS
jgi:ABC-type multidrug transport system fused ATPase/permease subunit